MFSYINYSLIFIQLWGLNKLLVGVPFYLIQHLIISNTIKIIYNGSKYVILGIGSLVFSSPIEVNDIPDEIKKDIHENERSNNSQIDDNN
jgi:hypothetical protein